jgi:hypothetical protein
VNLSVQLAPSTDCHGLWDRPGPDLRTRRSVQQRSTATTVLSNTFGFIKMRPGQRQRGSKRFVRGVRDEVLSDQLSDYEVEDRYTI